MATFGSSTPADVLQPSRKCRNIKPVFCSRSALPASGQQLLYPGCYSVHGSSCLPLTSLSRLRRLNCIVGCSCQSLRTKQLL